MPSVLESFMCDYVEAVGGVWDRVEPDVYDLLLPADAASVSPRALQIAFDPEALPEHPSAQLASFGAPLVESFLQDALQRGQFQRLYFLGLNLAPHDLAAKARRALTLHPGLDVDVHRVRALDFPQAFFWFEASFVSDQKEKDLLAVALDLHQGRVVRHRDKLLDRSRLADRPAQVLPEAAHLSLTQALPLAQREALTTLGPMAHARARELKDRLDHQVTRMRRYYADLAVEADASASRARSDEGQQRIEARRQSLVREEALRVAELRQKNSLRVSLRRVITLLVYQPKLLLIASLLVPKKPPVPLSLVWDPLLDALEPVACPGCRKPTFALRGDRLGVGCPNCRK